MSITVCERWFCTPSDLVGIDPTRARDLIIQCFTQVQHESAEQLGEPESSDADPDLTRLKAEKAVRDAFHRTGGDYENPDKASLVAVLGALAEIASVLGTPQDVIKQHTQEIVLVLSELPD